MLINNHHTYALNPATPSSIFTVLLINIRHMIINIHQILIKIIILSLIFTSYGEVTPYVGVGASLGKSFNKRFIL